MQVIKIGASYIKVSTYANNSSISYSRKLPSNLRETVYDDVRLVKMHTMVDGNNLNSCATIECLVMCLGCLTSLLGV